MAGTKGNQTSQESSSAQGSGANRAQPAKAMPPHPVYGEAIGTITKGMGKIMAKGADGELRALSKGDAIYQKDVIESPKGGFAQVTFADGSKFNLGSDAKLLVEKYLFDQINGEGKLEASMVKGVFRFISGKISYYSGEEPHTTIKTPVATIGVRGSQIDIEVAPDGTTTILHTSGVIDVGDASGNGVVTLLDRGTATVVSLQSGVAPIFVADDAFVDRMNQEFSGLSDASSSPDDQPQGGEENGSDPAADHNPANEEAGTRSDGTIDTFPEVGELLVPPPAESGISETAEQPESQPGASGFKTIPQLLNALPQGGVTLDNFAPAQGDTLTVSNTLQDHDGLGTISYQWLRDGVAIEGATGTSYTTSQDDVGAAISVTASYTDGKGTLESISSAVTAAVANVNDAPTGSVTLDNTAPQEGDLLTVSNTLADIDGLGTVSYQWQRDGVDIAGATGSSYATSASDIGTTLSVVASYTDGQGTFESVSSGATLPVANINALPTGSVTLDNSAPLEGDTITASNTLDDLDGLGTISYQWQRDGVDISGATGTSYTATQSDVGTAISVIASYTDGQGTFESVSSGATTPVLNLNNLPTGSVTLNNTAPAQGDTLTVSNTLADDDGLGTISYQWQRDGVNIGGATGTSYALTQSDVGTSISVVASYTDGQGTFESVSSTPTAPVSNINDLPAGLPLINGSAIENQLLSADTAGISDIDGLGSFSYQWQRDGINISGATGANYTLGDADVGSAITVQVSYVDGWGTVETLTSAATTSVQNVNDLPSGSVTLSGTLAVGQALTATNTLADADGLGTITYTWEASRDDGTTWTALATGTSYSITPEDIGAQLRVTASYTDGFGTAETVSSTPTAMITQTAIELSAVALDSNVGGFVINGSAADDRSGFSVSSAGDVNGDGLDDLIIGAYLADTNGTSAGASYVVFGKSDGSAVELSAVAAGTGGFVLNGAAAYDFAGFSVSAAGDVNGDGLADLLVGAKLADTYGQPAAGVSYVVFGKSDGSAVELSAVATYGIGGFAINGGTTNDLSGYSVSSAGDVNGDGLDDLIIGAPASQSSTGASYVVFGKSDGTAVELSTVAQYGIGGFVIHGVTPVDQSGACVSSAGDVNGDGLDDLIIGAMRADPNGTDSGASYVVFGKSDGTAVELSAVTAGTGGFVINGATSYDYSGRVSSAGDVNGDGLADLIVGAVGVDTNGTFAGASYVVFGKSDGTAVELSAVAAAGGGFVINGVSPYDNSGISVSNAGDVNGDGLDDLIVGASGVNSAGASYLVFGKSDGSTVELSAVAQGIGGFVINGASTGDYAGAAVAAAGDVNGDGFADLIVGANLADPNGTYSGASYVIFGGDFSGAVTQLGSNGIDTLTGTAASDNLVAGTGNDVLDAVDSGDVAYGGAGDDQINITALDFARIDGGSGTDLLVVGGSAQNLNLANYPNTQLNGIEIIELNGNNNTLTLTAQELQRLSESGNTLRITGDASNSVITSDSGWSAPTSVWINGEHYLQYTHGNATLQVQWNIDQNNIQTDGTIAISAIKQDGNGAGFAINGVAVIDHAGLSVSSAGDVNGDGFADLMVSARYADITGTNTGAGFVVFGKSDGSAVELSDVVGGSGGFVITGSSTSSQAGLSVSGAGDVNGDGLADLIISSDYPNASYVVFGKSDGTAVNLSAIQAGSGGFVVNGGSMPSSFGYSVSGAGDVNGDGLDDLIVGDPNSPTSYVVFGKSDGSAVNTYSLAAGIGGFAINTAGFDDRAGWSVSSAGDVNGDGLDDLLIGAKNAYDGGNTATGNSYVVFGKSDTTAVDLSAIDAGVGGFAIVGSAAFDYSGFSVSNAGDVNGDGLDDLIIGAPYADPNGTESGSSYVVFGKSNTTAVQLSAIAQGVGGFVIEGVSAYDHSGWSVSSAGDINGDGLADLIIGAPNADPNRFNSGASYVVFGKSDTTAVELSDIASGIGGFVINGELGLDGGSLSGTSVSSAGDVNGDGFADLLVGAPNANPNDIYSSGAGYVIFGGDFSGAVTQLGSTGNDTLTATVASDNLIAGSGDDVLAAIGSGDVTYGGAGNDQFTLTDLTFTLIDGGSGNDTLRLDANALSLDLGAIANTRLEGIEVIDLNGNGNALILSALELQRLAESGNTLRVTGDASNSVITSDSGWSATTSVWINGEYYLQYTNGNATLQVQWAVTQDGVQAGGLIEPTTIARDDNGAGFVINGITAYDWAGFSVTSAGDVNGDGFDDLLIGAQNADPNGTSSGAGYVVFGKSDGTAVELSDIAAGSGGFAINGAATWDSAGYAVSGSGDINGDGFADLLISAPWHYDAYGNTGASYVVFGKSDTVAVELSAVAAGSGGFVVSGSYGYDLFGTSVSSAGDVNGDGLDDLIVGAYLKDANGYDSGASYVIFGKSDGAALSIDALSPTNGFVINGAADGDNAGHSVSSAGDVNGDGLADLIIGASYADSNGFMAGASYVVFGKSDGTTVELSTVATGSGGFVINGAGAYDRSGFAVSGAGDVNGDGLDDLIVGEPYAGPSYTGASYVVFGKSDGGAIELSAIATGTAGFAINGSVLSGAVGFSVTSAGDVNGDGLDDLLIGDPDLGGQQSYLVFGRSDTTAIELSNVELGLGGFVITRAPGGGEIGTQTGLSVSGAGDVNGDGFADLLVGAPTATSNAAYSGTSYVIFGGDFTGDVTQIGTTGNDTLTGSTLADNIVAGSGNDTLVSGGGADVLYGGAGDDTIAVSDLAYANIDGGNGFDTLLLANSGLYLDLSADNLRGIESIDLSGSGNNTLSLSLTDVLQVSDGVQHILDDSLGTQPAQMMVSGDAGDTVLMTGGWTQGSTLTVGGQLYNIYSNGDVNILVDNDITVAGGV